MQKYDEPLAASAERGALPVLTVEPQYPAGSDEDGSVILYGLVGPQGQLNSVQTLIGLEPLASAAVSAIHQWIFASGRRAGANTDSVSIVVVVYRRFGRTTSAPQAK